MRAGALILHLFLSIDVDFEIWLRVPVEVLCFLSFWKLWKISNLGLQIKNIFRKTTSEIARIFANKPRLITTSFVFQLFLVARFW